jgi:hypothetical protein
MPVRNLSLLAAAALLGAAHYAPPIWTADIQPAGGSHMSGRAMLEAAGKDSSRATLRLTGAEAGGDLAWYVRSGDCGAAGPVVGSESAYPHMKADKEGNAGATLIIPVPTPASGAFAVTVHATKGGAQPVACGALKTSPSMPPARDSTSQP